MNTNSIIQSLIVLRETTPLLTSTYIPAHCTILQKIPLYIIHSIITCIFPTGNTNASDVASIKILVRSMYRSMMDLRAEVKNNINSLREDLNALNESVSEINTCLQEHKQHMAGELDDLRSIQANETQQLNTKIDTLTLNTSQQTEQLNQLQTSLNSKLDTTHHKLDLVHHKQDSTHSKLDSLTATTAQLSFDHQQIQANISDVECSELNQNLKDNLTHQLEKIQHDVTYIHGELSYTCGGTGGWRRVVYLDMTDPSTTCPSGWNMTGYSKRTCGRATDGTNTSDSATFRVRGGEYTRICGRIRAYQWGHPEAFAPYHYGQFTTIDSAYIDGVSVTHGIPRNHIWTFAAGKTEGDPTSDYSCPCDTHIDIHIPSFVEEDYFCESGVNEPWVTSRHITLHSNDTLWDGEDCLPSSTCCSQHNPPYFVKQLLTSTTDDIEARICLDYYLRDENIAVELVELYVQ